MSMPRPITKIVARKFNSGEDLPNREYDIYFASRLEELAAAQVSDDTMRQMRDVCKDMWKRQENGYDSESIRERYREVFTKYGFCG